MQRAQDDARYDTTDLPSAIKETEGKIQRIHLPTPINTALIEYFTALTDFIDKKKRLDASIHVLIANISIAVKDIIDKSEFE